MLSVIGHGIVAGVLAALLLLYGPMPAVATEQPPRSGIPVALLLPLQSPAFGKLADFVRQGVIAAAKSDPRAQLAINVYATTDNPNATFAAYERALAEGNRL